MARTTKTSSRSASRRAATKTASHRKAAKAAPRKTRKVRRAALDVKPIRTKLSQAEIIKRLTAAVYDDTDTTPAKATRAAKATVKTILGELATMATASMMPKGAGVFTIPGIAVLKTKKIKARKVAAIKKGTLVRNPRTGEEVEHPGRKASVKPATVKVRAVATASMKRAALGTE